MGFASSYIDERTLFGPFIKEAPHLKTGIIVVIPSYGEPDILKVLDSLASADKPDCNAEVIIVVNAPENASGESLKRNRETLDEIESWKKHEEKRFFRLFSVNVKPGAIPGWGVGLARKTGMDEAVRRFDMIDRPDGIIVNLDADCTVDPNYFTALLAGFSSRKDRAACSIYFEHILTGSQFPDSTYRNIVLYELHLRYYFQGLGFSGFPYVFHTVGSAMAVRALRYIRAGGMNRRQAGEDFYLIQKLVPSGGYFSLNSTKVHPSPRHSFRVPFGTGATIGKLSEANGSAYFTYNFQAFKELKKLFDTIDTIYNCKGNEIDEIYASLPAGLQKFIRNKEWSEKIAEIKKNTSGLFSFRKRFFVWFNMFRIVKYLNFVHTDMFIKKPVEAAACELLEDMGISMISKEPVDLLIQYRNMEKFS